MVVRSRRAFTLVELLVVIAIISLLIAMLLPAIQAARESGRRAVCQSNLKQFATAVHTFNTAHNTMPTYFGNFPEGSAIGNSTTGWKGLVYGSWYIHLMPFMENSSVYGQIVNDVSSAYADRGLGNPVTTTGTPTTRPCSKCDDGAGNLSNPVNQSTSGTVTFNGHTVSTTGTTPTCPGGGTLVTSTCPHTPSSTTGTPVGIDNTFGATNAPPINFCPSDPSTQIHFRWNPNSVPTQNYALLNYSANFNAWVRGANASKIGLPQPMSALTDGTSQTILFGEAYRLCDNRTSTYGVRLANYTNSPRHNFGIDTHSTANTFMFQDHPTDAKCDNWRVQAMHPGTLMVVFADTHVKGIAKHITRKDGSDPDNPTAGGDPYATMGSANGAWDMLLLPADGGTPSFE